jgi:Domain of unknown function (DUF932)
MDITKFNNNSGFEVSERYKAVNTTQVVDAFKGQGFELFSLKAAHTRNAEKQGFQKHMLTFRHPELQLKNVGDSLPQVLLSNSYDGSSAYRIMLGVFRLVCSNGLVVAGPTFNSIRVRHVGNNAVEQAIAGAFEVAKQTGAVAEQINALSGLILTVEQQLQFADEAKQLLFKPDVQVDPFELLRARRTADVGNDAWRVLNRVQENIIQGGVSYRRLDANGRLRNGTRRSIRAIDANVKINQELWQIATKLIA